MGQWRRRARLALNRNNSDCVEYGACGESPTRHRADRSAWIRFAVSCKIAFGWRRLRTPVISKNETTRNGVASHTSGSSSGTAGNGRGSLTCDETPASSVAIA